MADKLQGVGVDGNRERDTIANEQRQLSFHIAPTTSAYRLLHMPAKSSGSTVVS